MIMLAKFMHLSGCDRVLDLLYGNRYFLVRNKIKNLSRGLESEFINHLINLQSHLDVW